MNGVEQRRVEEHEVEDIYYGLIHHVIRILARRDRRDHQVINQLQVDDVLCQ